MGLPVCRFRDIERALGSLGFQRVRQRGSHVFFRHADGRTTTVPDHSGRDVAPTLLRKILSDIGVDPAEFLDHL